ncbi:MAG: Gfo/Idh/MocA family protein [Candidatus Sifarchaeia archaeon]
MDVVKFGVVGCGSAAFFHVLPFKGKADAKLRFTAAHDIDEKSVIRFSKRYKLTPYHSLEELLESDIDAVLLAVPHHLHASLTKAAAEAGKHVLCEKPMAITLEECDEMIAACRKNGVKLMIAENHRFLPAHRLIKETIERGLIGDVFLGRAYEGAFCPSQQFLDPNLWNFTLDKAGGGVVADQGCHKFATLNWFLGEVDSAQCWLGKAVNSPPNKGEDNAIILLRYKSGAMITVDVSSVTVHPLTNRLELHGTKGTILEDHSWEKPVQIFSSHEEAEIKGQFYSPVVEHGVYPKYYTISARHEDMHFAECIIEDRTPEFAPEAAKEAVAVTLLAYLSAKKGTVTKMDELREVEKSEGTMSILDGLESVIQKNYEGMSWG